MKTIKVRQDVAKSLIHQNPVNLSGFSLTRKQIMSNTNPEFLQFCPVS